MYPKQRQLSKPGFESQFATNHLGHFPSDGVAAGFAQSHTQRPGSYPKRGMHKKKTSLQKFDGDIHFDDINFDKDFDTNKAYVQSKLANLLFPYELVRQFKQHGIQAVSTAAHPGSRRQTCRRTWGFWVKLPIYLSLKK